MIGRAARGLRAGALISRGRSNATHLCLRVHIFHGLSLSQHFFGACSQSGCQTLCGYRSVVYVFICYVRSAEALRQVVKAGSKIIEVVWARKIAVQPRRGRGHHNSHPP
jgi:hypothetical protein